MICFNLTCLVLVGENLTWFTIQVLSSFLSLFKGRSVWEGDWLCSSGAMTVNSLRSFLSSLSPPYSCHLLLSPYPCHLNCHQTLATLPLPPYSCHLTLANLPVTEFLPHYSCHLLLRSLFFFICCNQSATSLCPQKNHQGGFSSSHNVFSTELSVVVLLFAWFQLWA